MTTLTARLRARAVLMAMVGSVAFGGLLALEHVAPNASRPPVQVIDANHQADQTDAGSSAEHARHCTDSKGTDVTKNKHCRAVSGAQ